MLKFIPVIVFTMILSACSNISNLTLYQQLDGQAGLERLVDSFINQIGNDEQVFHYFEYANISHFRAGFLNHLCVLTDGPCEYTRDSMVDIHTGMNITEADFNHVVDLLINAMNEQNIDHTVQNKILARMAPLRKEIIKI
ncbi:group 1 truncated hemoglobin [Pseudoalteromonas haloplanktis]|uniref:Group 1 truncated hemoglobin n=2 Tax=Pseudoalteromonas haloplanktis TaxID=228 RepID=A0ABU1BBL8_PSEHA|nr:group 1 truncated hemoglobin [Pseudoalteromonas haloplanktis]MDQ9091875.1 group 1 truncated hemoglobin [Pseudoalteromonas haloplanktis]